MTIWQRVALCVAVGSAAADAAAQEEDSAAVSRSGGAGTAQQIPAPAGARQNTGVEISIDDGIEIKSADGDFSIKINGRLHADWARHEGNRPMPRPSTAPICAGHASTSAADSTTTGNGPPKPTLPATMST